MILLSSYGHRAEARVPQQMPEKRLRRLDQGFHDKRSINRAELHDEFRVLALDLLLHLEMTINCDRLAQLRQATQSISTLDPFGKAAT